MQSQNNHPPAQPGTQAQVRHAYALFKQGRYPEAMEAYERILASHPEMERRLRVNIHIAKKRIQNGIRTRQTLARDDKELSNAVFVGMAAIPDRVAALEASICSLLPQAERIGVYLNGWEQIPSFLQHEKIIVAGMGEPDIGDVGKFHWVDDHDGYYFTCDDDLIYPPDYIARTLAKLRHYHGNAAVGWHGSVLMEPFARYYDTNSRKVFLFGSHRPHDTAVHILGTGCCAFHTQVMQVRKADFTAPNMADIFFALNGQKQKIPFYVIEHEKGAIREAPGTKESSIYADSHQNKSTRKNTHELQNQLVRSNAPWLLHEFQPLSILIIGRFNSFQKGGIYKSCHLIQEHLSNLGHHVSVLDTQHALVLPESAHFDLCWIYPGDPERPDFATVVEKIRSLQKRGIPVLVNLSYLYQEKRTTWIRDRILECNAGQSTPVLCAVFTESAAHDPLLADVRDYVCVVPKTIEPPACTKVRGFGEREGVCLGDATKLSNPKIIGGPVHAWIDAIFRKMPYVNLYAFKQYQGDNPHSRVQYVPHMKEEFGDWLGQRRLFLCLNIHTTFEMVSCEAQYCGTPVLYRHMPHSLSEYISTTGMAVRNPEEMAEMVTWLYNDPAAWERCSRSSLRNAESKHVDVLDASLEGYLRLAVQRARRLTKPATSTSDQRC
ncbi:glycosyltransferase [Candidatus Symbiobacter mobilis]|uniref:Cell wall biogenesis glycosyltransferase n=1 Tax=Candidatus Symbiobacter mobilis CR TaxID=946483 RepID=U5NE84_9BURK|nr:glycosyltransferase [Candidatus Symbiobacter mobilis]AGX88449.1 cell wall biogenesis glycosyltransferase [Candidatus Symbiobacter mobilis CR]